MARIVRLRASTFYGKWTQVMTCFRGGGPMGQRYFLKVLAVTATLSANSVAKGSTTKLG